MHREQADGVAGREDRTSRPEHPFISVVVPLYNEEASLAELHRRVSEVLQSAHARAEIVLVDDGSADRTPELLRDLSARDSRVKAVLLSRNFGQQAAITAGLDHAVGDAVVIMDADLQDPPELLPRLLERWREGSDVVYAVRRRRRGSLGKRLAYRAFYRLLGGLADTPIPMDSGDFGLLDRRVVRVIAALPERHRFLRGLRAWVGFRHTSIEYDRPERAAGVPGYSLKKLITLALDGLFGFSYKPIHIATFLGVVFSVTAFALGVWAFADRLTGGPPPQGWASTVVIVTFIGGVQLLTLGIIGEYIRRIYDEVRERPLYVVREVVGRSAGGVATE